MIKIDEREPTRASWSRPRLENSNVPSNSVTVLCTIAIPIAPTASMDGPGHGDESSSAGTSVNRTKRNCCKGLT